MGQDTLPLRPLVAAGRMGASGGWFRWEQREFEMELVIGPLPSNPPGRSSLVTWASVWRIAVRDRLPPMVFSCEWMPGSTWITNEGPASGGWEVDWLQLASYRDDGIDVCLPHLLPGERAQCQFLCAWAPWAAEEVETH